ncbi:hypothetical protein [Deinococcus petrolearius]|uniref:Tetratricopeptide repeat protein n=1 Tax=Deinococcus petrolearius TaxID=1751295 RepID=A0ABW1DP40_9DEIO
MLTLYPDLGDLLRLHPQFNAGTVVEALRLGNVREVWWASGDDPDHPLRDALPAAGFALRGEGELAPDWRWADAERAQLEAFLAQYPQGRERLRAAAAAEADLAALLGAPLTPARLLSPEVMEGLRAYHAATRAALDEGPGTRWQARRLDELAARLGGAAGGGLEGAVLVPLDDLPGLLERLPGATLPDLGALVPGETSRLRALADRAWQLREDDDLPALFAALTREAQAPVAGDAVTPLAELRAAAGGLALAAGDLREARAQLEAAAHALRGNEPRSLAGLVLARLGQVRDLQGERDLALRTYRAALALAYAPEVARETAAAGLHQAFVLGH